MKGKRDSNQFPVIRGCAHVSNMSTVYNCYPQKIVFVFLKTIKADIHI